MIVSLVICVGGFIHNTFGTFEKFILGAKLVLITTQDTNHLPLPTFVICNDTAYKQLPKDKNTIWQEKEYVSLTRNPEEMQVQDIKVHVDDNSRSTQRVNYTENELRTVYNGRCNVIKVDLQVRSTYRKVSPQWIIFHPSG